MKRIVSFLCAIVCCLNIVMATPISENPKSKLFLILKYSSDIQPDSNDVFSITYLNMDGNVENVIDVNTYELEKSKQPINISPGRYKIKDIVYIGDNEKINEMGFAYTNEFEVLNNMETSINLSIGFEEGILLESDYSNVTSKKNNEFVESLLVNDENSNENILGEINEESNTENLLENDDLEDDSTHENDKVEIEEEVVPERLKFKVDMRLLFLVVLGVGGSITIFILNKKGKL